MTAQQLIAVLQAENPEAELALFWDGAPRGKVEAVYESEEGKIVLAGEWSDATGYDYRAAAPKRVLFE